MYARSDGLCLLDCHTIILRQAFGLRQNFRGPLDFGESGREFTGKPIQSMGNRED